MLYGVVKNYDIKTKTADIVTVESNPILLNDIPVWSIFTGSEIFNIPLQEGTSGIILFGEIDSTDYLYNGNIGISFVNKAQDKYANALFIPGFNSFVAEYDCPKDGIYIRRGNCSITIKTDAINYASKSSSLDILDKEISLDIDSKLNVSFKDGKLSITNTTGEMVQLLSDTMQHLSDAINALLTATVATALGPATLDPATILTLTTLKTQLDSVTKTKFDTFI